VTKVSNQISQKHINTQKKDLDAFLLAQSVFDEINGDLPRKAREELAHVFDKLSLKKTEFNWLMLSLAELISNLIKHPENKPSLVKVSFYALSTKEIVLDISDDASSFYDFEKCKAQSLELVETKKLTESGRGLALIDKAHPDHEYETKEESYDGFNHFRIWYPKRADETHDVELKAISRDFHKEEKEKANLVLVDDDSVICFFLENILKETYNVKTFLDPHEALAYIKETPPDMIISDLYMPNMTGAELRQALNEVPYGEMIPFVFLSADEKSATRNYINSLGIDDFLLKPVNKEKLVSVIERLLLRSEQIKQSIGCKVSHNISDILSPSLPEHVSNWQCAVRHTTASTGGGDFLLHKEDVDNSCIVLADVMGHGLEAKFFAYAFAGYLRSVFHMIDDKTRPDVVLNAFSKAVNKDPLFESTIITCVCLDVRQDGRFLASVAAHPSPYVIKTDGSFYRLNIQGALPGLMGDNKYNSVKDHLNAGDRLIFFTDGLIDGPMKSELKKDYALTLIKRAVLLREYPLNEAMDHLWSFYQSDIRSKQILDDATVIMLEYGGSVS